MHSKAGADVRILDVFRHAPATDFLEIKPLTAENVPYTWPQLFRERYIPPADNRVMKIPTVVPPGQVMRTGFLERKVCPHYEHFSLTIGFVRRLL